MEQAWQAFMQQHGARYDGARITDFGDAAGELRAAESGSVLVPLTGYGLIRASGEEAGPFLHNLFTNDVKALREDAAQYNSLCSAKGRMLANFLIWRDGGDYVLRVASDLQPMVQKKLGMYVLRSKVKLSDASNERILLGVSGTGAEAGVAELARALPDVPLKAVRFDGGMAINLGARRFQLVLEPLAAQQAWERLARLARPAGFDVWRWLDVRDGIPTITAATQEHYVPQMVNFELIGGVDFRKGCYPGQEIVARTQYLGKLKRRMYRAHTDAPTAAPATDLFSPDLPDQACGSVVDAAPAPGGGLDLLAVLQTASAEAGEVHLGAPDGPRLQLAPLPYAVP